MAQITTNFTPIFITRSDGKIEIINKGSKQNNGPSAQQLNRTPNEKGVSDYYRELDPSEPKHQDWRKKLGGMLVRELGGPQKADLAATSILWEMPENYRLYEHIKSKAEGDKTATKNHSGGGHDRQDAYLYGHPRGPKKRFRSPADFFPHLLWLATDETGDPENCTCKLCCPEQLEVEKPAVKEDIKAETPTPQVNDSTPVASPAPGLIRVASNPIVQINRRSSASTTPNQSPALKPASVPAVANGPNLPRPRVPPSLMPTPLPQPRSVDQQIDSRYQQFLCRTGEVVWFHRGTAWGLGAVVRRWTDDATRSYMVQPFSHPFDAQPTVTVSSDTEVRPWLAWSPPPCTYSHLRDRNIAYDGVDWQGMVMGTYSTPEDTGSSLEVDASIIAAKTIDSTYTLIDYIKSHGPERHWNGLFLGGEKIWNGEPVRIKPGTSTEVMVITSIIERTTGATLTGNPGTSTVTITGDIYSPATIDIPNPASIPELPSNQALPQRMREDMNWRNKHTLPTSQTITYWRLMASHRLPISDIKGRWYEASILFPTEFQKAISSGKAINTNMSWMTMNTRGDAGGGLGNTPGIRKENRLQAFGAAVPRTTMIVDGIAPPQQQQQAQSEQQQQQQQTPAHEDHLPPIDAMNSIGLEASGPEETVTYGLDEFMNLDGIDGGWGGAGHDGNFGFQ